MSRVIASLVLVLTVGTHSPDCSAQFSVFPTLDDLLNETPKTYSRSNFFRFKSGSKSVIILRDTITKEKRELDCAGLWGFEFRGALYRVVRKGKYYGEAEHFPARLYLHKELFFWINGYFLENEVAREPAWNVQPKPPFAGFISATLDGDLLLTTSAGGEKYIAAAAQNAGLFFDDHPEFEWLKECVHVRDREGFSFNFALHCMEQHRTEEEED